jgi:hypothetical protein
MFVVYLSVNSETTFSPSYPTFTQAKNAIEPFLDSYAKKMGKALKYVGKNELDGIEDVIYVRKKTTQATLYHRVTHTGRIYNTYSIAKLGKLNVTEFTLEETEYQPEVQKKQVTVENMSHGVHGNLLAELREKIGDMRLRKTEAPTRTKQSVINSSNFIDALKSQKDVLNHVDPPVRKLIL